ncbi:50S ribosomal protein L16 [Candidatus Woesearchaeota archaeon]|nr:50S ribosomal protein L16 [Candidatus Woesearchaeota archaeon]MBT6044770.1 50S ribosomal protein L16 [Candidatus Woesearchaeota archaeon]
MATLRRGHCSSPVKRAYTRKSKYRRKNYIRAVPTNKVIRYDMGEKTKQFSYKVELQVKEPIQIRHNALESCRQIINRNLIRHIGQDYYLKLNVYPHQVIRENKMLTGAGADRMQTGMQRAFGTPTGVAARLRKKQTVFSVKVEKDNVNHAKAALKKATPRMPGTFSINIVEIKK